MYPETVPVEAIFTFDKPMPAADIETGEACLSTQTMAHFTVPVEKGEISEAAVLFALLSELSANERQHLCKVSLAFGLTEEEGKTLAPWLDVTDSPLFNGKLWLKQHAFVA